MSLDEWVPICNVRLASRPEIAGVQSSISIDYLLPGEVIGKFDLHTHVKFFLFNFPLKVRWIICLFLIFSLKKRITTNLPFSIEKKYSIVYLSE